jgi:hypothetical protein
MSETKLFGVYMGSKIHKVLCAELTFSWGNATSETMRGLFIIAYN